MIHKIGEEIRVVRDYEIETILSEDKLQVKEGDKGFVDSSGSIHYTSGQARGKIHRLREVEVEGYDQHNIAKMIFKRIKNEFMLEEHLEGYDLSEKDFIEEIEDVLSDIL